MTDEPRLEVFTILIDGALVRYGIDVVDDIDRMGLVHAVIKREVSHDEYVMAMASEVLAILQDTSIPGNFEGAVAAADRLAELCENRAEFDEIYEAEQRLQAHRRTYLPEQSAR